MRCLAQRTITSAAGSPYARIQADAAPHCSGPLRLDVVLLASNRSGVGKTALAASIASCWSQHGHRVTYLRVGTDDDSQEADTEYLRDLISQSQTSENVPLLAAPRINPLGQTIGGLSEALASFSTEATSLGRRLLLEVSPPKGEEPRTWALCGELAEAANSPVVAIVDYPAAAEMERLDAELRPVRQRLHGLLVNSTPPYRIRGCRSDMLAQAERATDNLLGMIPEDRVMLSPTIRQVADYLNAEWVVGEEQQGNELASRVLIGGNLMDPGVTYFGRYPEQAVLVRGDRPDIQLAALGSQLACLILTGGHQPIPYVYHEAKQKEVTVLVVASDTHATAEAMGELISWGTVHHREKAKHFTRLLERHCDTKLLQELLA